MPTVILVILLLLVLPLLVLVIIVVTTAIKMLYIYKYICIQACEVSIKYRYSYLHFTEEKTRLKYPRSQGGKEVEIRFDLTLFESGRFKVLFSLKRLGTDMHWRAVRNVRFPYTEVGYGSFCVLPTLPIGDSKGRITGIQLSRHNT